MFLMFELIRFTEEFEAIPYDVRDAFYSSD